MRKSEMLLLMEWAELHESVDYIRSYMAKLSLKSDYEALMYWHENLVVLERRIKSIMSELLTTGKELHRHALLVRLV